jgi:hypothetical protein
MGITGGIVCEKLSSMVFGVWAKPGVRPDRADTLIRQNPIVVINNVFFIIFVPPSL